MAYIEVEDVTFTYPDTKSAALQNLSLQIEKGQFVVLFGPSGCGKSTLLHLLKKEIQPHGDLTGHVSFKGESLVKSSNIQNEFGFVFQDPENQLIAGNVLHELAFGLENIGLSTNEMRNRLAEMIHFFGAEPLLHRETHELSGGQKQQLNLASVLLMQPSVLLLDEPTAQLDPVSAREFLNMLVHLNEEFGITIIMAEHRLDEVVTFADKVVMMKNGQVLHEGEPQHVMNQIWRTNDKDYVPAISSYFLQSSLEMSRDQLPLSVKSGRKWIRLLEIVHQTKQHNVQVETMQATKRKKLIEAKDVHFQFHKEEQLTLKELNFSLYKGDFYALLGGNGSGKSTFMKILCGLLQAQRGKVLLKNKKLKAWGNKELTRQIAYLPQDPKLFFIQDTIKKEIEVTLEHYGGTDEQEVERVITLLGIAHLLDKHPYDVSGGELQKAALACLLLRKPEILLLDEPTKGLDPVSKQHIIELFKKLQQTGMTIFITTHDVEFAARYATRCGMMFQGNITAEDTPKNFFKGNFFYTTMMQRLFRGITDDVITIEEAVQSCQ